MKIINMDRVCAYLLVLSSFVNSQLQPQPHGQHPHYRNVELSNESGEKLIIDWIDPVTKEIVELGDVSEGQTVILNSFVNHTFQLRTTTIAKNGTCDVVVDSDGTSRNNCTTTPPSLSPSLPPAAAIASFIVQETEDQVYHIKQGLQVDYEISNHNHHPPSSTTATKEERIQKQAQGIVEQCKQRAIQLAKNRRADKNTILQDLYTCMETNTVSVLEQQREELKLEEQLRIHISKHTENYTCADNDLTTTQAKEIQEWNDHHQITRKVHLLHNRQASKIHMIENFISPEECKAIENAAAPKLHDGTVADGKGGSTLSDNRKAKQAGVHVPYEDESNLITQVMNRVYEYTNAATGYNISTDGQEDLMSIQYFGRGPKDTAPDRYTPHCDGDCDGLPHKHGGRVATMVMYCDAPLVGGGTNFQNAGVYVKPTVGAAAFFSYMDPITYKQETGWTTHSGCPVIEGTKRIAVHWMRIGVDKENPWNSFDTLTISKKLSEQQ